MFCYNILGPLPSTAIVRVMVVYADFTDMQKKDPIKRCLKDTKKDTDIGDRFIVCQNDGVEYTEYKGHDVILVPVVNMPCEFKFILTHTTLNYLESIKQSIIY